MSITDYLLARIGEDEAVAQGILGTPSAAESVIFAQRMLAECAAKRRMIGLYEALGASNYPDSGYAWEATKMTLKYLAAIYADHPDYRAEWKVGA